MLVWWILGSLILLMGMGALLWYFIQRDSTVSGAVTWIQTENDDGIAVVECYDTAQHKTVDASLCRNQVKQSPHDKYTAQWWCNSHGSQSMNDDFSHSWIVCQHTLPWKPGYTQPCGQGVSDRTRIVKCSVGPNGDRLDASECSSTDSFADHLPCVQRHAFREGKCVSDPSGKYESERECLQDNRVLGYRWRYGKQYWRDMPASGLPHDDSECVKYAQQYIPVCDVQTGRGVVTQGTYHQCYKHIGAPAYPEPPARKADNGDIHTGFWHFAVSSQRVVAIHLPLNGLLDPCDLGFFPGTCTFGAYKDTEPFQNLATDDGTHTACRTPKTMTTQIDIRGVQQLTTWAPTIKLGTTVNSDVKVAKDLIDTAVTLNTEAGNTTAMREGLSIVSMVTSRLSQLARWVMIRQLNDSLVEVFNNKYTLRDQATFIQQLVNWFYELDKDLA